MFALVVMGALAEKLTLLVDGGMRYYEGKVVVTAPTQFAGLVSTPLKASLLREIEHVEGVARVSASVSALLDKEIPAVSMGNIPTIQAEDGRAKGYEKFVFGYTDVGKVALGADLVKRLNAAVGGHVEIRGKRYEVVGIAEKTLTAPEKAPP